MSGRREGISGFLRRLLLLALSLLPFHGFTQNALVLIQHDRAGPNILPPAEYSFYEWVRWPEDQPGRNNRILSVATGIDLEAELADTSFKLVGQKGRTSNNAVRLQARGYFDARRANLGNVPTTIVENPNGGISPSVYLLALDGPTSIVRPLAYDAPIPTIGLVLYEAERWDDAIALAKRVTGRTLILEYPPDGEDAWSRYWLKGPWPAGLPVDDLGVPGLVRAGNVLSLLLRPQTSQWRPTASGHGGEANRWLAHGRKEARVVLFAWFALGTFVIAWALAQVMNEDRGPFVSEMLVLVALSPAALVLAGALARLGGIEAWPLWIVVALVGLYALSSVGQFIARRVAPNSHPLWAACLVGLSTLVMFDPLWSDLSNRFGRWSLDVPGEGVGAWVAYLTGAMAFAPERGFGRAIGVAMLAWGATARPWWVDGHSALLILPGIALAVSEGLVRPTLLLPLAALPTGIIHFVREGVVWAAEGLLPTAADRNATNLWLAARFLISPQWIASLGFLATLGLIGNRFLAYRLGKLWRLDPRLRALPWTALATLALGVTEPLAIPAVPIVALAALVALAYDGLRANA